MWRKITSFFNIPARRESRVSLEAQLIGPRLILRAGDPGDWKAWRTMRDMSRSFLVPWEPEWPRNGLSYSFFCGLLRRHWRDWRQGKSYAFMVFLHGQAGEPGRTGALIGGVTLSDVYRGIAQKGTLGYWIGEPYAGKGYMTEAADLVCNFAFNTLRLHRIEASCLPHNEPSKNLLRRLGFDEEGYAKLYLQINGQWQDHILWGKTAPRFFT